jgi:L-amino acid N-acyltransferase YncA
VPPDQSSECPVARNQPEGLRREIVRLDHPRPSRVGHLTSHNGIVLGSLPLLYVPRRVLKKEMRTGSSTISVGPSDPIGLKTIPIRGREGDGTTGLEVADPTVSRCLVRASTPADMVEVTAIYARFVEKTTATFEIVAPDESEMLRRRQAVLNHDLPYLVAELEGYIVGFCYASQFRPREGYRFTVEDSIYVRPDCIGHGVGKMLLSELISDCQAKNCHSMVACICGVNVSSVALHSSLGFQQVGLMPEAGNKFGEWLRLLIMQRRLQ